MLNYQIKGGIRGFRIRIFKRHRCMYFVGGCSYPTVLVDLISKSFITWHIRINDYVKQSEVYNHSRVKSVTLRCFIQQIIKCYRKDQWRTFLALCHITKKWIRILKKRGKYTNNFEAVKTTTKKIVYKVAQNRLRENVSQKRKCSKLNVCLGGDRKTVDAGNLLKR